MVNTSTTSRIAKNAVLLYTRSFVVMLISLYTSREVLRILGVNDMGIYNVVGGMVVLFAFLDGGQNATYQRFFNYAMGNPDKYNLSEVFSTSLIVQFIIAVFITLLTEIIGLYLLNTHLVIPEQRMNAAHFVFHFSVITLVVNTLSIPYGAMIIAKEDMGAFAYIDIINVVLKLLILFIVEYASFDRLIFYGLLVLCIQLLTRVLYTSFCHRHYNECHFKYVWNKFLIKEMTLFSSWIFLSSICSVLTNQGLSLLYNIFFGVVANAAIAIGNQVRSAILKLTGNITISFGPQLVISYASNQRDKVDKIWTVGSKFTFGLFAALAIPVIIDADYILSIWLVNPPKYTTLFVRLILIENLVGALTPFSSSVIRATGDIKYFEIVTNVMNLIALLLIYVCLRLGCDVGVPYFIMILKSFFQVIYSIWIACKKLLYNFVKYILSNTFLCALVIILSFILGVVSQPEFFTFIKLAFHLLFTAALVFGLVYFLGCLPSERSYVNSVLCSLYKKMIWKK